MRVMQTRLTLLLERANQLGVTVHAAPLPDGTRGYYDHTKQQICLHRDLPEYEAVAELAHELIHAERGHQGHQDESTERTVDEKAAILLIDPLDYAQAENMYDAYPGSIARELDLPVWVVEAWQRHMARRYPLNPAC